MLSLLYLANKTDRAFAISEKHIKELLIDKIAARLTPDIRAQKEFIDIISTPLFSEENIKFRQDIIKDFIDNNELFEMIFAFSANLNNCEKGYDEIIKTKKIIATKSDKRIEDYIECLNSIAFYIKRMLISIHKTYELIGKTEYKSSGIFKIYERMREIIATFYQSDIICLLSFFEKYSPLDQTTFYKMELNTIGKIINLKMIYPNSTFYHKKEENLYLKKIFRKSNRIDSRRWANLPPASEAELLTQVVSDVLQSFELLYISISKDFLGIENELKFYKVVLLYYETINARSLAPCYPIFSDETELIELYDLFLLCDNMGGKTIPNDFIMRKGTNGVLIEGENGHGKTVFLRSIVLAHLLAYAGLPLPAKSAILKLRKKTFIYMAGEENNQSGGDYSGRFEKEVQEMQRIVNTSSTNDIVFLNEVFQTTDYSEASEGISGILDFFSYKSIDWILVTHLNKIEKNLTLGDIKRIYMDSEYKAKG